MKIKDAIAHYKNSDIELDDPLYTLIYFAEKNAKKIGWVNVYFDENTAEVFCGKIWENKETAFAKIEKPDSQYIGTLPVEYYSED